MKRAEIAKMVKPFADRLAEQMTDVLEKHVSTLVGNATGLVLDHLKAQLEGTTIAPAPQQPTPTAPKMMPAKRQPKVLPAPKAAPDRRAAIAKAAAPKTPSKRPVRRCSKCGAEGYYASGCGKTHNKPEGSDEDSEGPAVEPIAESLASRTPSAVMVAAEPTLELDPLDVDESDDVDGGGDFPVLPGTRREPFPLSPTDAREFCPEHGWVGRLAFQRDNHAACRPAIYGEPCFRCRGTGIVTTKFCAWCGGTGVEPERPVEADDESFEREDVEVEADVEPAPTIARTRTIRTRALTREERERAELETATFMSSPEYAEALARRPRTRGECAGGERPCPWASCRYHLSLDVHDSGSIQIYFPGLDVDEIPETCALDVADRGGATLIDIGTVMNVTRERIRQLETKALRRFKGVGTPEGLDGEAVAEFPHHDPNLEAA